MTDRNEFEAGQTYGFGANARRKAGAVCRRTTGLLSILALALVVALAATVITVMPTETSAAVSSIDPLLR
jgi:hypothetical protein